MVVSDYIKLVSGELLNAMQMNINENFISVSFQKLSIDGLHFRFIMKKVGKLEEELIDDIVAEFEALHMPNELNRVEIVLENSVNAKGLENLVFARHL
ncbi:hypothetical protein BH10ACI1_BH10ACI1_08570 [soil metagenome]